MKSGLWRLFRFIYGSGYRVAIWLTVVGGSWLALRALGSVGVLFMADRSPQCPEGNFAPPCTESVFRQIVLPITWDLLTQPAFAFLILGIVGIAMRRRWILFEAPADFAGPVTREIRLWTPFRRLYGADCRLAIWFMILGSPWLIGVLNDVNQAYALNLPPYTYSWVGGRPQIEGFFEDVLVPIVANNFWNPGAWLMIAGTFGTLGWWMSYLWQRRYSTRSSRTPGQ